MNIDGDAAALPLWAVCDFGNGFDVVAATGALLIAQLLLLWLLLILFDRVKLLKSFGSYFSPIFSKRLRSSSNIDFLANTDLTMSDGFTSWTSSSRNLWRLAKLAAASVYVCERLALPPFHFSNISSRFLMRSSNDGLAAASESLEFGLNDWARDGLSGGCSIDSDRDDEADVVVDVVVFVDVIVIVIAAAGVVAVAVVVVVVEMDEFVFGCDSI